jgi:PTH2 family peptidyl-tRNA hydrolase
MGAAFKQVAVVRLDLKMSSGKLAAQTGHAFVDAYQNALDFGRHDWIAGWREGGMITKIVLGVEDELALVELFRQCSATNLPTAYIVDYGLTELPGHNATCMAIGPGPSDEIDKITGHLKRYRSK